MYYGTFAFKVPLGKGGWESLATGTMYECGLFSLLLCLDNWSNFYPFGIYCGCSNYV